MAYSYDEMQGSEQDVLDHPANNHADRQQLAGDINPLPISPGPIEALGKRTYDRELRRSPADNTFRKTNSMNTDWDSFNSKLPKK